MLLALYAMMCANVIIASEAATGTAGMVAKKSSSFLLLASRFLKGVVELRELTWLFFNCTRKPPIFALHSPSSMTVMHKASVECKCLDVSLLTPC